MEKGAVLESINGNVLCGVNISSQRNNNRAWEAEQQCKQNEPALSLDRHDYEIRAFSKRLISIFMALLVLVQ
jgi:hypothetical protein